MAVDDAHTTAPIDRLLKQLTPQQRDQVQRLSLELGIRPNDHLFLLLVVLQYYLLLLQDIPAQMGTASDSTLTKINLVCRSILSEMEDSVEAAKVQKVRMIKGLQTEKAAMIHAIQSTIKELQTAAETEYRKSAEQINQELHQQQLEIWQYSRTYYLKDVHQVAFLQSLGIGIAALVLCAGMSGWIGWQLHQMRWAQRFGSADRFEWFTELWFLKDNQQRFQQCHKTQDQRVGEDQQKCTIWYQ